ncbi:hypothetical protein BJ165DRAFT_1358366 [Panaeolus papilionaceus]|nr:hypothetical protein BJ165DRAFT_1358366 [Panaeolus papilionaceus]
MVGRHVRSELEEGRGYVQRFKRYNDWGEVSPLVTANWSISASPLPSCHSSFFSNPAASNTIASHPSLFKIVSPVKLPAFLDYVADHPNPSFIHSVSKMFTDGAFPHAILPDHYPEICDMSSPPPADPDQAAFLISQRDLECAKDRYSKGFENLEPGMYVMPVHAVPKDDGRNLRLVTDHSKGEFSLNSMIEKSRLGSVPLDGMKAFGSDLIRIHNRFPDSKFVAWKSDVSEAYRLIPMHPLWQIKQVEFIDGLYHVNRCNVFGGRSSQALFIAFISSVTWIAKYKKGIEYICAYSDDHYGVCREDDVEYYPPYDRWMPSPQVQLLLLWDELGIPHKSEKQVSGNPLIIIGIKVDVNNLILTLDEDSIREIIRELDRWIDKKGTPAKNGQTLRQWQKLAGWLNWSFNVFPLLRPCLSNVYDKMAGKTSLFKRFRPNNAIRSDLSWASHHLSHASGILVLEHLHWDPLDADLTIFTDACLDGMGYYVPEFHLGFVADFVSSTYNLIFLKEALCVLGAFSWACSIAKQPLRIVIFCDNTNVVDIFNSLSASPRFNPILKRVVDLLTEGRHDLKVLYVPGERNMIADALSRSNFYNASRWDPALKIDFFEPPRITLGPEP